MPLQDKLAGLIIANVEFNNADIETAVEDLLQKNAAATAAGIEFETLANDDEGTLAAADGLVGLAGELGVAFPNLKPEQAERVKNAVNTIFNDPSPELDAAGANLFNASVDVVLSAQALNVVINDAAPFSN